MADHFSSKPKPKTILVNPTTSKEGDRKISASKTAILKSLSLVKIEDSLETAEKLLKSEQILEGMNQYEQIFSRIKSELPKESFKQQFAEIFKKIAVIAIGFLNTSKKETCFSLLTRLERTLNDGLYGKFPELETLIFNHLGCYFRRIEKIELALQYYQHALDIIEKQDKKKNAGLTHMNLSAVYSQMQSHENALRHAKLAVNECQFDLMELMKDGKGFDELRRNEEFKELVTILAISYHNLGNEEELADNLENARNCFQKSVKIINENFGPSHPLYTKFSKHSEKFEQRSKQKKLFSQTLNLTQSYEFTEKKKMARPASANLLGMSANQKAGMIQQAYQLNPQAIFFVGSQVFIHNPPNPKPPQANPHPFAKLMRKTPLKAQIPFRFPSNCFKSNAKSEKPDIESLENKGVLTWESQISDEGSEPEISRNRTELLNTLNNLKKSQFHPNVISPVQNNNNRKYSSTVHSNTTGGILRKRLEEGKINNTDISEKMLSFENNSTEKTPKNNKNPGKTVTGGSPNKVKSKSISFSKQGTSPPKRRKTNNEELQRAARKIQKAFRNFIVKNRNSLGFKILQHFPSYSLPQIGKKAQVLEKKTLGGSLLILYYRKTAALRVIFKSQSQRRIHTHTFEFVELRDERLKASLFDEFINKVLPLLCLFGEGLVLKAWALTGQKSQKIKINKFIFEEIVLVFQTESITRLIVPFFDSPSLKSEEQDPNPLFTKRPKDEVLSNSSQTSLRPLINNEGTANNENKCETGIFPLITHIGTLSEISFVEPLLNNEEENPKGTINNMNSEESPLEPILKTHEETFKRNSNASIMMKYSLEKDENNPKTDRSQKSSQGNRKILNVENTQLDIPILDKKVMKARIKLAPVILIQRYFRMFSEKRKLSFRRMKKYWFVKRKIFRKSDVYVDFRIITDKFRKNIYFRAFFLRLSDLHSAHAQEKSVKTTAYLRSILAFSDPMIWIKFNIWSFTVNLKNPQVIQETLSRFSGLFEKIPQKLKAIGFQKLVTSKALAITAENTLRLGRVFDKVLKAARKNYFSQVKSWSASKDHVVFGTRKVTGLFRQKKMKIWRQLLTILRLTFELSNQLSLFCQKTEACIDKLETKKGYLKSFKKVFLFSKFKDCVFLDQRFLYYKKKTIEAYCYFHENSNTLLIYTLGSEVAQYEEEIDFEEEEKRKPVLSMSSPILILKGIKLQEGATSPSLTKTHGVLRSKTHVIGAEKTSIFMMENSSTLEGKVAILKRRIKNITMIQDLNSIQLKFKLYPEEYLYAARRIQQYRYKKLYSKTFGFTDLKSGKIARVYLLLQGGRIHLLIKNEPALMSSIYEISREMCCFLKIAQKVGNLESFLGRGLYFSPDKNEIVFKEPVIPRVWFKKTLIFDAVERKDLSMNIDLKTHKLVLRIENEEKFFKLALPPLDLEEESCMAILRSFAKNTLENTIIIRESDGKHRILNDDDAYGPLIYKEDLSSKFLDKKFGKVIIRVIDIKKTLQVVVETPAAYSTLSLVSNSYIPFETEDLKKLITEYLRKYLKENLVYDPQCGIVLRRPFYKIELDEYLAKNKGIMESPRKVPIKPIEIPAAKKQESRKMNQNIENMKEKKKNRKKRETNSIQNKTLEKKVKEEKVVLEGDIQDYEKAALMIQRQFRGKSASLKKNTNPSPIKSEPPPEEVVLEGDIQDYEKAALKIQRKFRGKGGGSPKKSTNPPVAKPEPPGKVVLQGDILKKGTNSSDVQSEVKKTTKKEPMPKKEEVILEGDIEDYEKAASLIQKKFRMKQKGKPQRIQSPPLPKGAHKGETKKAIEEFALEGNIEDYEKAAMKIQAKYRKKMANKKSDSHERSPEMSEKHNNEDSPPKPLVSNESEPKPFSLEGEISENELSAFKIPTFRKGQRPDSERIQPKSAGLESRYSLPSKAVNTEPDFIEESDKMPVLSKELQRKHSFKNAKRNSLFSRFKGRTFEIPKQSFLETSSKDNDEEKNENYKIMIFPAPEDLEIAVAYLQEWWRGVIKKRRKAEEKEVGGFLEDIGFFTKKTGE